ncbi:hypothetical protein PybrP1_011851 [[Pythium] brassicae (nom. inval.)]|nr:hypothetical protein PybrP1_011851 [[Pythium] brassicae (nom. inval.)]
MVATKLSPLPASSATTPLAASNNSAYEIRSGMSVQDLKQLTAQRAQRQRMEYWDLHARNSPRDVSDWGFGSPAASSASSSSSSSSLSSSGSGSAGAADSPPRQYSKDNMYAYPNAYAASRSRHHAHYYPARGSLSLAPSGEPERMFVTCGGQVVSFMEGVVNAPQFDLLPEMLNATL